MKIKRPKRFIIQDWWAGWLSVWVWVRPSQLRGRYYLPTCTQVAVLPGYLLALSRYIT